MAAAQETLAWPESETAHKEEAALTAPSWGGSFPRSVGPSLSHDSRSAGCLKIRQRRRQHLPLLQENRCVMREAMEASVTRSCCCRELQRSLHRRIPTSYTGLRTHAVAKGSEFRGSTKAKVP